MAFFVPRQTKSRVLSIAAFLAILSHIRIPFTLIFLRVLGEAQLESNKWVVTSIIYTD